MRTPKIGAGVFAAVAVVIAVGLVLLPRDYVVTRTATIDAPIEVVFAHIVDVEKQQAWSPCNEMDPDSVVAFGAVTVGEGASFSWSGPKTGKGTATLTQVVEPTFVEEHLVCDGMGESDAWFELAPEGGGTRVTWGLKGTNTGILGGVFAMATP